MNMYPRTATVLFAAHKHCFVCVPASWKANTERDNQVSLESCVANR